MWIIKAIKRLFGIKEKTTHTIQSVPIVGYGGSVVKVKAGQKISVGQAIYLDGNGLAFAPNAKEYKKKIIIGVATSKSRKTKQGQMVDIAIDGSGMILSKPISKRMNTGPIIKDPAKFVKNGLKARRKELGMK